MTAPKKRTVTLGRADFVDATVEFMSHPCFLQLRSAADVGTLLFEDLDRYQLPEGYTKDDIWRILTAIRKQAAVFIPEDPEREADMWMITTSALSFDSEMMEVRTKGNSSLARSLEEMQGSAFITRFLENTLIGGLRAEDIVVDEERVLIGTYKALGYGRARITSKYLIYAAAASLLGSAVGIAVLSQVLPWVIMEAYSIVYFVPRGAMPVNWPLALAAAGDFSICLYNPSSKKRADYLRRACDILLRKKSPDTVCGWVRNIGREGQQHRLLTLARLRDEQVDMFTTVFIGAGTTQAVAGRMVTPRGYEAKR